MVVGLAHKATCNSQIEPTAGGQRGKELTHISLSIYIYIYLFIYLYVSLYIYTYCPPKYEYTIVCSRCLTCGGGTKYQIYKCSY